ncbi:DNA replication protein [Candidatus Phytoplasma oryzae]|uniref:DNA replication protein n=1 Tax=Candidatus Phytoplasma oryzae TaxID=203274 RepID=A0A328IL25_9MOLU|nr:DnaD domain protein [Candidatus Phytoplasma oryzae]RAM57673.1 DNA replication protein [Candidatus Phytoplasma oryzae]
MLKILYEEGYLNIEKILMKEYLNLNLEIKELFILLLLFVHYYQKKFSSLEFSEKIKLSKNKIEIILEKLMKKDFFTILQKKKNDKIIEILNLDNTFFKLEKFFSQKKNIFQEEKKKKKIQETIENLEKLKGKILSGFELEIVKSWYFKKKYSHKNIQLSIKKAFLYQKSNLNYIEKILNDNQKNSLKKYDFQTDEILHKIFKKIK